MIAALSMPTDGDLVDTTGAPQSWPLFAIGLNKRAAIPYHPQSAQPCSIPRSLLTSTTLGLKKQSATILPG